MPRIGRNAASCSARYGLAAILTLWFVAACTWTVAFGDLGHVAHAASSGSPPLPGMPPGTDMDANVAQAKAMSLPANFMRLVRTEGAWDFRWRGFSEALTPYSHSGHFHYGVMSKAYGLPQWLSARAAAMLQTFGG